MNWIWMAGAVIAPVILSNLIFFLEKKHLFRKLSRKGRQAAIGVAFGILACLATQFGISYDGYVMNVRSAAPLTAGLLFGGPAGIIAGVIGALYRWFSVYWGIPSYTRLACTLATLFAGFISYLCRKYMFSNKKTSWVYGTAIAISTEVFHMLLVFLTHLDNIQTAFQVVRTVAVPMILANGLSVCLSCLLLTLHLKIHQPQELRTRTITQRFAGRLLICVILSFFATSYFTIFLQRNISNLEVAHSLSMNVDDVKTDILVATDRDLLSRTESIQAAYERSIQTASLTDKQILQTFEKYLENYNVSEINLVDENGVIVISTYPDFVGYKMASGAQSEAFLCLLNGEESYVQSYQEVSYDSTLSRKYAGIALKDGGFIQVGYDFSHFQDSLKVVLKDVARNRHIGQEGFLFILSQSYREVVSAPNGTVDNTQAAIAADSLSADPFDTVLSYSTPQGEGYYYLKSQAEGYIIVGCIPQSEADFSQYLSVYISGFMQLLVFFVLFVTVFLMIKNNVVKNIHKINSSLAKISDGDLSTRVDIRESSEFVSLSNDINATVERLKGFIREAEQRVDMELSFASSIQHSVLPSVFPPYPNRTEFDIYALMDTAKEVGGDFYDFYLLGENQLVFLVADVSGKGIPAAMFMMNAKSVIKSLTESGLAVADIFTEANQTLCEGNEAGMFVTAWMGILDLTTGVVRFANAGHNPPLIRHKDGTFDFFKSRPGLVLAGMEDIKYREGTFNMAPGDEIFLYTDGVTEATDAQNDLFGEVRLQKILNQTPYETAEAVCRAAKEAVDAFVGKADQFDDITMLSLKYNGVRKPMKELTVTATVEALETVTAFVDAALEAAESSPKALMQINVAIDEIFSNIVHYAYPNAVGDATVGVRIESGVAQIVFTDSGIPFNPLERSDPDITLSAEERDIGGLGIFMVKKTMDSVAYAYRGGKNTVTVTKTVDGAAKAQ